MDTVFIQSKDVTPGDDLVFLGEVHRITRVVPYSHPVVTKGEVWPQANAADGWGINLSTHRVEILRRSDETRRMFRFGV